MTETGSGSLTQLSCSALAVIMLRTPGYLSSQHISIDSPLTHRTIHSLQRNRDELRILSGTKANPNLHRLNGNVITPLFHHLGASSWHSFDASLIVSLGRAKPSLLILFLVLAFLITAFVVATWRQVLRMRRTAHRYASSRPQSPSRIRSSRPRDNSRGRSPVKQIRRWI